MSSTKSDDSFEIYWEMAVIVDIQQTKEFVIGSDVSQTCCNQGTILKISCLIKGLFKVNHELF